MVVEHPLPGVVHVKFETQEALCRAFVRLQEFYESPYPEIRGKHFTLEQLIPLYVATHGAWTYYSDWHGFNMPGRSVYEFFQTYGQDTNIAEFRIIEAALRDWPSPTYLIGTHRDDDITHELAHALYDLNRDYRHAVNNMLTVFMWKHEAACAALHAWLLKEGYCEAVLNDEYQAYLATNEPADWNKEFDAATAAELYAAGEPLRHLLNGVLAG